MTAVVRPEPAAAGRERLPASAAKAKRATSSRQVVLCRVIWKVVLGIADMTLILLINLAGTRAPRRLPLKGVRLRGGTRAVPAEPNCEAVFKLGLTYTRRIAGGD